MDPNADDELDRKSRQLVEDFSWLVTKTWIVEYHSSLHLENPWAGCGQCELGVKYQYGSILCPSNMADPG